jgi:hypothetical protein
MFEFGSIYQGDIFQKIYSLSVSEMRKVLGNFLRFVTRKMLAFWAGKLDKHGHDFAEIFAKIVLLSWGRYTESRNMIHDVHCYIKIFLQAFVSTDHPRYTESNHFARRYLPQESNYFPEVVTQQVASFSTHTPGK